MSFIPLLPAHGRAAGSLSAAWHSASLRLPAQVKAKSTLIFFPVGPRVGKQGRPRHTRELDSQDSDSEQPGMVVFVIMGFLQCISKWDKCTETWLKLGNMTETMVVSAEEVVSQLGSWAYVGLSLWSVSATAGSNYSLPQSLELMITKLITDCFSAGLTSHCSHTDLEQLGKMLLCSALPSSV